MVRQQPDYDEDPETFKAETYESTYWKGVALRVLGWEILVDTYTEQVHRTGNVVVRMVGDDKHWYIEPSTLTPVDETGYCHDCGQIGCKANIYG